MTYVVTDACIKCKYMDCVEVCPVDCFYEGEVMLVINPNECIDCGVCEPECPAEAILPDTESGLEKWLELNTSFSAEWPNITRKKDSPADADEHKGEEGKYDKYFTPDPGDRRLSADRADCTRRSFPDDSSPVIVMRENRGMFDAPSRLRRARGSASRRRPLPNRAAAGAAAEPGRDRQPRHVHRRRSAAAIVPDYEGSDDYRIIPAGAIRGKVSGISFTTRGTYLYVDVVPAARQGRASTPGRSSACASTAARHIKDESSKLLPEPQDGDRGRRLRRRQLPRPDQPL